MDETVPQSLNSRSYISIYNMVKKDVLHSPTLDSIIMVENTIKKYTQECGKYQLWKKLPKKMMYQTFLTILAYLEESHKILIDKDGCIMWMWDPEGIKKILSKGVRIR